MKSTTGNRYKGMAKLDYGMKFKPSCPLGGR